MYIGYVIEKLKVIVDIKLETQEQVEQWIYNKLSEHENAWGILVCARTGKPIREYANHKIINKQ